MKNAVNWVEARRDRWRSLDLLLTRGPRTGTEWSELSMGYRVVCSDLADARAQGLSDDVLRHLDDLASRGHNALYGARRGNLGRAAFAAVLDGFPRRLRTEWRFFLLASVLFYGPFVLGAVGAAISPEFGAAVMSDAGLASLEDSYSDAPSRNAQENAMMAGFYVNNNVGIAFRCFATGALAGLGSVFFLVYNGLLIGASFGHLASVGLLHNLMEFTSGHSAWELTAICVSGAAGLRLGWAILVTHGRTRTGSVRAIGPTLFDLVLGTFVMLVFAALIEGFWSASPIPRPVKYGFGVVQWGLVIAWLWLGGRR